MKTNIKGSEKQITWANSIKKCAIEGIDRNIDHPSYAKIKSNKEESISILDSIVDSKFWIENRNDDAKTLIRKIELGWED